MSKDNPVNGNQTGSSIDWDAIHQSLEQSGRSGVHSERERRAALKARANALARTPAKALGGREVLEIIEFTLAGESYGVELGLVREVHPLKDFTALPGAPDFVLGIINLRGEILSVVDLKKFFSLPSGGLGELNKVIVIRDQWMEFGILADFITGTRKIALDEIHPAPPTVTGIGAEYLKGVTGDRLVIIDAGRILGDDKIIVRQEAE